MESYGVTRHRIELGGPGRKSDVRWFRMKRSSKGDFEVMPDGLRPFYVKDLTSARAALKGMYRGNSKGRS